MCTDVFVKILLLPPYWEIRSEPESDPDPKFPEKSDPDPNKIISDPQQWVVVSNVVEPDRVGSEIICRIQNSEVRYGFGSCSEIWRF